MHKKKTIYCLSSLFIGLLMFSSRPIFSQNTDEDHDIKKLEKVLVDYNNDSKRVLEDAAKLEKKDITDEELTQEEMREFDSFSSTVKTEENTDVPLPEFKKEKIPVDTSKMKFSESVVYLLQPLQELKDPELKKIIVEKVQGSGYEFIFSFEPKLYDFCVGLIKDKTAISQFSKIPENRYKLLRLFYATIFTFLLAWIVKKAMYRKNRPFVSELFYNVLRITFFTGLRIGLLWFFFSEELRPTVRVFTNVFL